MIDLHCHILPGVDDGAATLSDACSMARMAVESGVRTIVATPHCNNPGRPGNFRDEAFFSRLHTFQDALQAAQIPLQILPGAEVLAQPNVLRLLRQGQLMTLNGSRYLLIEFCFGESEQVLRTVLAEIAGAGYTPVLAHPERYDCVQENPMLIAEWFRMGYLIQLNKGSILGRLGRPARQAAIWILNRGLAHMIASDAHSPLVRTTSMDALRDFLEEHYPPEYIKILLEDNPNRVIHDRPIVPAN